VKDFTQMYKRTWEDFQQYLWRPANTFYEEAPSKLTSIFLELIV